MKTIMRTRLEEARCLQEAHSSYLPGQLGYLATLYNNSEGSSGCWSDTGTGWVDNTRRWWQVEQPEEQVYLFFIIFPLISFFNDIKSVII